MLDGSLTLEEQAWVNRIESLRDQLNASREPVSIADFGAVSADVHVSAQMMAQGQIISKTVGEVCESSSKSDYWAFLLFKLIRTFRPNRCLELGTCVGISGAYEAAALNLNGGGRLVTLEGADAVAAVAVKTFRSLGLDNVHVVVGRFEDTLDGVLQELRPIDYAFIDGHHDERATLAYFNKIHPFLGPRALLVFDDVTWSDGMRRAWAALEADPRIKISFNVQQVGVCVLDPSVTTKLRLETRLALPAAWADGLKTA